MPRLLVLLTLALCACGPVRPGKPEVVRVPGPTQYVSIREALTAHPPLPPLTSATPFEAVGIAKQRRDLLEQCYGQLDQIKAIEGTTP